VISPALALAETAASPDAFSLTPSAAQRAIAIDPRQQPLTQNSELADSNPSSGAQRSTNSEQASNAAAWNALYLADDAEKPNIHGFFSSPFKTAYVTPRGLVVENAGVVWQPVVGLIFPVGEVGPLKNFAVIAGIWNFPQSTLAKPDTEHNIDLKVTFNDSDIWGGSFALKPYIDLFYEVGGSSTVVLGKNGSTGYLEFGIGPTYTWKSIPDYPITFTFPIYTSVGPSGYWDATKSSGNWGLVSAAVNASMPLSFIPPRYGNWHVDAGVTYYYLINDALLRAGTILSGNDNRNVIQGSLGVGVNF
jgi:hypothetical protein